MAGFVLAATVLSAAPGGTASAQQAPTAVMVAAGDISTCNTNKDEATAKLLDGIAGTVATLGDNVYPDGTSSQFTDCYHPTWGRHKARTRPSPGNHDYHVQGAAGYFNYFGAAAGTTGQGWYSYELGGWHVIVLNSECAEVGGCDPNSPQGRWLAADLAASTNPCKLAYWHKPLFSSGAHGANSLMKPLWDALYPAGVDVILNGHEHIYERFARQSPSGQADPAGIRQFTVGTGGAALTSVVNVQPNSEARNSTAFGVLKLTLQPGRYDWQFVPIAGSTFTDTGTGNCGAAGGNVAPQANAGPDQQINSSAPATATLDGTGSTDDTGITTYAWTKVSGPDATINGPGSATTTVSLSATGSYTFRLTVTDAPGLTNTDTVLVTLQTAATTEILMVVGDATTLTAGDTAIRNRLTAAGYEVTVMDDNAASLPDASQHDLVMVTASIASGTIDADIADVTVPVLVAKPFVLDDFGLTASPTSNYGTKTVSTISIVNPGDPTAAGLSGNIILRNSVTTVSWGIAPPGATVVATAGGDATIWNIAPGDPLADNTPAPACRLSFPLMSNMPTGYTTNAWTLFDATITHATTNCDNGGGSDDPPVVVLSAPVGGSTVAGVVPVLATASDDGVVVSVEFRVDGGLIGTDTDGGDGWSTTWDTAAVADGNHTLEATATDDAQQIDTDSVTVTVENTPSGSVVILMVVGDATTLTAGDTAIRNRLTAAGYEVTVMDDNAASLPDASQHDLVMVTASIASGTIDADIADVTVPVLVAKPFVLDDFGLTASPTSNYGTKTVSTISIVNPGDPTAAGLSGNIILRNSVTTVSWGIAPPGATVVATAGGDATIWNIAPGDPLADNTPAPACRLSFPLMSNMPTGYTTNAWTLFDATITHATTNCDNGG